jgi:hypothetical protein
MLYLLQRVMTNLTSMLKSDCGTEFRNYMQGKETKFTLANKKGKDSSKKLIKLNLIFSYYSHFFPPYLIPQDQQNAMLNSIQCLNVLKHAIVLRR